MKIIEPSYEIITPLDEVESIRRLKQLESAARTCYKSEELTSTDETSAIVLIRKLIGRNHFAMLEHGSITVRFIIDRGVSHELVRHRIASFAQESTRYCNYSKDKFDNEITVIRPCYLDKKSAEYDIWKRAMEYAENSYFDLLCKGQSPQEARAVLPNSLKTELVVTANYREWRHIFELRCGKAAHPQMQKIMVPLYRELRRKIPIVFDDIFNGGVELE